MNETVYTRYLRDQIKWLNKTVSAIRAMRAEYNISPGVEISLLSMDESAEGKEHLDANKAVLLRIARISSIEPTPEAPANSARIALDGLTLIMPLTGVIDLGKERARLGKETEKWAAEIRKVEAKLSNEDFVSRAPPEIIEEHQLRKSEAEAMLARLEAAQKSLSA